MRSYTVASVWGIPIRVNVSLIVFLPILAWIIGSGTQIETYASLVDALSPTTVDVSVLTGGSNPWPIGVAAAVGLFVSVALHELIVFIPRDSTVPRQIGREKRCRLMGQPIHR